MIPTARSHSQSSGWGFFTRPGSRNYWIEPLPLGKAAVLPYLSWDETAPLSWLLSGFVGCFLLAGKSAGRALPVWREEIPTLALLIGLLCLLWSLFVFDFVRPIHISRSGDQESSTNVQSLSLSVCASFLEGLRGILRINLPSVFHCLFLCFLPFRFSC